MPALFLCACPLFQTEDERATLRMTCDTYELGKGDRLVLRDSPRGRRTYFSYEDPPPDVSQPFIMLELRSRSEGRLRCSVKAIEAGGDPQSGQVSPGTSQTAQQKPVSRPEPGDSKPPPRKPAAAPKPSAPRPAATQKPTPPAPAQIATTQKPKQTTEPPPASTQKPKPAATQPRPPTSPGQTLTPAAPVTQPAQTDTAANQTRGLDQPVDLNDPVCGRVKTNVRIVGGEVVPRKALPWMVGGQGHDAGGGSLGL